MAEQRCRRCGVCCIAPDISSIKKPLGVRCQHLDKDQLCAIYEKRPDVCRSYQPWEICDNFVELPQEAAVAKFLELFGLCSEA